MKFTDMTRDASVIHAGLVEKPGGMLIAKVPLRIYTPKRFEAKKLAIIASEVRVIGIFAIVIDQTYAVSKALAMMQLTPSSTSVVKIDDDEYYEFSFDAGAVVCPNINLVQTDQLAFKVYDEIIAGGHIPGFIAGDDLAKLFDTAKYHCNVTLSPTNAPLEMIAAAISRDPSDLRRYYRHAIETIDDQKTKPPHFIAFRNVIRGATNTTARLMGSYFDDGIMSALVNPSEKAEGIETLLRS